MTNQEIHNALMTLKETRMEISRINQSAGETVFNPAVTQQIEALLVDLMARV